MKRPMFDSLPRERLAFLPTPLHPMKNLANSLGLDSLWIKRDDLTGLGGGGNKSRKLEFVLADALNKGADTVVTVGAVQSNHCRQTAAAAAVTGLRCVLLLSGEESTPPSGNLLLDRLFGAEIKFFPGDSIDDLHGRMDTVLETLEELGLHPYAIPAGASTPLGAIAYAEAMFELREQLENWDFSPRRIVVAAGTGGTLAGMILGAHLTGLDAEIVGVSVLKNSGTLENSVRGIIERAIEEYPQFFSHFEPKVVIDDRFVDEGYGVVTDGCVSAIRMFAKTEGIVLDPIYTAKAGLSLIRMTLSGEITSDTPTLFWHTGGEPALYAHCDKFL